MAQRQSTKRIDSAEVQGDGSYVILKSMKYEITRKARRFVFLGDAKNRSDLKPAQIEEMLAEEKALSEQMIFDSVVEWDWVNDAGEPISPPKIGDDLDKLTNDEVLFLVENIIGLGKAEKKASAKP